MNLSVLVLVFFIQGTSIPVIECLPALVPTPVVLQEYQGRWIPFEGDSAPLVSYCVSRLEIPPPLEEGRNPLSGRSPCRPPVRVPVS